MHAEPDPLTATPRRVPLSRRHLLFGAGSVIVLAGCSGDDAADDGAAAPSEGTGGSTKGTGASEASSSTSTPGSTTATTATTAPGACVLTPELTAGPYHLDGHLARADITEDRGHPARVQRPCACPARLRRSRVPLWTSGTATPAGEYSGFNGNSLEATQAGRHQRQAVPTRRAAHRRRGSLARFSTIFPGWYEGRTVHIHLKVLDGGTLDATYTGGHVAHVGQAFFDEATTVAILDTGAYRAHTGDRTTNEEDSIYAQAGPGAITAVTLARETIQAPGSSASSHAWSTPTPPPPPAPLF
ncbi:MAG: hypothetical protein M5U19_08910 [Microthrixaceae bacterium]|nr:hypothetical protein [Microthrixaceae bacterium]